MSKDFIDNHRIKEKDRARKKRERLKQDKKKRNNKNISVYPKTKKKNRFGWDNEDDVSYLEYE